MPRPAKSRARLGAWLCAVAGLAAVPSPAQAQASAEHVVEDIAVFRGALSTVWANARVTIGAEVESVRFARQGAGMSFTQPETGAWTADDETLPLAVRLLAAMVGTGTPGDAIAALGFRLTPRIVAVEPFDDATLVVRVGTDEVSVTAELGIARPREIRLVHEGATWTARATEYDDRANGWLPTRVVVARDGDPIVELVVTDLARTPDDLPPVSGLRPDPDIGARFPRMPL